MVSDLFFYELALFGLLWLCIMLHHVWPSDGPAGDQKTPKSTTPPRKRSHDPKPFPGLTRKPCCVACEQAAQEPAAPPPPAPLPPITSTRGRPRQVDTSQHFCPHPDCAYRGRVGLGNLRANGHPSGGPWRQLYCSQCKGYFLETHGTPFHGKRVSPDLLVWAVGALAEGLGIRAVARVFEVDPNTVLQWLVEVADHLKAFSQHFLHDVRVTQVQLDELYALLSAVKEGDASEAEALKRLSRSPHWVWAAIDPVSKLLLTLDVGARTLAMAQRVVHQVVQVLAPGCVPLFLTDGLKEYATALLTHCGHWRQPERRQAKGPLPKPRWMPLPQLLYAQVIKVTRRRRLVEVRHRVVFGTKAAVEQVLTACGWQINTAFIERVNLSIRQHVAAVGRRVMTLCKGEDGLHQQLVLYHGYYNFCLPHASLRQPLPQPEPTNGSGSAKRWQPRTPAMAAGLTDHVWTLREVLRFPVPPWPQPQAV
jgi:transposase-like protein/IS1 family transposase